jgi:hypothetical protein
MIKSIIAFMSAMFQTNHQPSISQPVEAPPVDFERIVGNVRLTTTFGPDVMTPGNVRLTTTFGPDVMTPGNGRDMARPPHISIPAGQGGRRRIAL